jgi:5'-nucleotidase
MTQDRPLRILISNDDGIHAEGLKVIERIARKLTDDVWVVAPLTEQSGVGHALTYRDPLRLVEITPRRYTVNGTPADCVILAIEKLLKNHLPDLVLSGINHGENVAESLTHSGTVAVAMEATLYGVPAISLSLATKEASPLYWESPEHFGPDLIRKLLVGIWPPHTFMNVNFPHLPINKIQGIRAVRQGKRSAPSHMVECIDPRGRPYYWVGIMREEENAVKESDIWALQQGNITVTPVHMDMTNYAILKNLNAELSSNFNN